MDPAVDPVPARHPPLGRRIWGWVREHKAVSAALIALIATLRFGRWALASAWAAGEWLGFRRVFDFLVEHWLVGLAACGLVFVAVFLTARLGIERFERYEERRKARKAKAEARREEERDLAGGGLLAGVGPLTSEFEPDRRGDDVPLADRRPRIG